MVAITFSGRGGLITERTCQVMGKRLVYLLLASLLFSIPTIISAGPETKCYAAIHSASKSTGVPENLLLAIANTETGRTIDDVMQPWPWAINIRGKGEWLNSESMLLERALEQVSKGEVSFDVGCFQLNYRWHGDAFESLDAMIAPKENALYAAQFLQSLYTEFADWKKAVGAYHSRDEARAKAYRERFEVHFEEGPSRSYALSTATRDRPLTRSNSYPLLKIVNGKSRLGSLVSLGQLNEQRH